MGISGLEGTMPNSDSTLLTHKSHQPVSKLEFYQIHLEGVPEQNMFLNFKGLIVQRHVHQYNLCRAGPGFHNRAVQSRQREPGGVEQGTTEQGGH